MLILAFLVLLVVLSISITYILYIHVKYGEIIKAFRAPVVGIVIDNKKLVRLLPIKSVKDFVTDKKEKKTWDIDPRFIYLFPSKRLKRNVVFLHGDIASNIPVDPTTSLESVKERLSPIRLNNLLNLVRQECMEAREAGMPFKWFVTFVILIIIVLIISRGLP